MVPAVSGLCMTQNLSKHEHVWHVLERTRFDEEVGACKRYFVYYQSGGLTKLFILGGCTDGWGSPRHGCVRETPDASSIGGAGDAGSAGNLINRSKRCLAWGNARSQGEAP